MHGPLNIRYQSDISNTAPCPPYTCLRGADMDTFTCFTCDDDDDNNNNNNNCSEWVWVCVCVCVCVRARA